LAFGIFLQRIEKQAANVHLLSLQVQFVVYEQWHIFRVFLWCTGGKTFKIGS